MKASLSLNYREAIKNSECLNEKKSASHAVRGGEDRAGAQQGSAAERPFVSAPHQRHLPGDLAGLGLLAPHNPGPDTVHS